MKLKFWNEDTLDLRFLNDNYFTKRKRRKRFRYPSRFPFKAGSIHNEHLFGHYMHYDHELWEIYDSTQKSLRLLFGLGSQEYYEIFSQPSLKRAALYISDTLIEVNEGDWYKRYGNNFYMMRPSTSNFLFSNFSSVGLFTRFFDSFYRERIDPKWPKLPRPLAYLGGLERITEYEEDDIDFDTRKFFYSGEAGSWLNIGALPFSPARAFQRFRYADFADKPLKSLSAFLPIHERLNPTSTALFYDLRLNSGFGEPKFDTIFAFANAHSEIYFGRTLYWQFTFAISPVNQHFLRRSFSFVNRSIRQLVTHGWQHCSVYTKSSCIYPVELLVFMRFFFSRLVRNGFSKNFLLTLGKLNLISYMASRARSPYIPVLFPFLISAPDTNRAILPITLPDAIRPEELFMFLRPPYVLHEDFNIISYSAVYLTTFVDIYLHNHKSWFSLRRSWSYRTLFFFIRRLSSEGLLAELDDFFFENLNPFILRSTHLRLFNINAIKTNVFYNKFCGLRVYFLRNLSLQNFFDVIPPLLTEVSHYPFCFTDLDKKRFHFLTYLWLETKVNNLLALRVVTQIGAGYPGRYEPLIYYWFFSDYWVRKYPLRWLYLFHYGPYWYAAPTIPAPASGVSFNRTAVLVSLALSRAFKTRALFALSQIPLTSFTDFSTSFLTLHILNLFKIAEDRAVSPMSSLSPVYSQLKFFLLSFYVSATSTYETQFVKRLRNDPVSFIENRKFDLVLNASKLVSDLPVSSSGDLSTSLLSLTRSLLGRLFLSSTWDGLNRGVQAYRLRRFYSNSVLPYSNDLLRDLRMLDFTYFFLQSPEEISPLLDAGLRFSICAPTRSMSKDPLVLGPIPSAALVRFNEGALGMVEMARSAGVGVHVQFFRFFLPKYLSVVGGQLAKVAANNPMQILEGSNNKFLYFDNISEKFLKNELAFRVSSKLSGVRGLRRKDFSTFYFDNFLQHGFMNTFDSTLYATLSSFPSVFAPNPNFLPLVRRGRLLKPLRVFVAPNFRRRVLPHRRNFLRKGNVGFFDYRTLKSSELTISFWVARELLYL